jgi:hydrogenase nickel incorporation protein HypA/HybF
MHDIHLANKIHKLILEEAEKNQLKKVYRVVIELGSIEEHGSDITAENLDFNLSMLLKGTMAEAAKIEIVKIPGHIWRLIEIQGD